MSSSIKVTKCEENMHGLLEMHQVSWCWSFIRDNSLEREERGRTVCSLAAGLSVFMKLAYAIDKHSRKTTFCFYFLSFSLRRVNASLGRNVWGGGGMSNHRQVKFLKKNAYKMWVVHTNVSVFSARWTPSYSSACTSSRRALSPNFPQASASFQS